MLSYHTTQGLELESWMVPQTIYWMYHDQTPVGYGRIWHWLNENLKEHRVTLLMIKSLILQRKLRGIRLLFFKLSFSIGKRIDTKW